MRVRATDRKDCFVIISNCVALGGVVGERGGSDIAEKVLSAELLA